MIRTYRTLVRNDIAISDSYEYALGKIDGILLTYCELPFGLNGESNQAIECGTVLTTRCEAMAYSDFVVTVQWLYPGLCEFYYELT